MIASDSGAFDGKGTESDLITDHKYKARGEWYTLCVHCRLARAAHAEAEPDGVEDVIPKPTDREVLLYHSDNMTDD